MNTSDQENAWKLAEHLVESVSKISMALSDLAGYAEVVVDHLEDIAASLSNISENCGEDGLSSVVERDVDSREKNRPHERRRT